MIDILVCLLPVEVKLLVGFQVDFGIALLQARGVALSFVMVNQVLCKSEFI
jgi:hypothetical protein